VKPARCPETHGTGGSQYIESTQRADFGSGSKSEVTGLAPHVRSTLTNTRRRRFDRRCESDRNTSRKW
jgi:hypothetical protein